MNGGAPFWGLGWLWSLFGTGEAPGVDGLKDPLSGSPPRSAGGGRSERLSAAYTTHCAVCLELSEETNSCLDNAKEVRLRVETQQVRLSTSRLGRQGRGTSATTGWQSGGRSGCCCARAESREEDSLAPPRSELVMIDFACWGRFVVKMATIVRAAGRQTACRCRRF